MIHWHEQSYGTTGLTPECIGYENGVLGGVVSALKIFCQPGDSIIIQSPTYIGFTHCAEDNGWKLVLNPLIQDETGIWRIDYKDLEEKSPPEKSTPPSSVLLIIPQAAYGNPGKLKN